MPRSRSCSSIYELQCPCTAFLIFASARVQVPIYAHVKQTMGPKGVRDAIEINYMKFLAFNGSYKPFGWIPAGALGAHDADWEHVTVRLSPDAQHLLGAYYSAHR